MYGTDSLYKNNILGFRIKKEQYDRYTWGDLVYIFFLRFDSFILYC